MAKNTGSYLLLIELDKGRKIQYGALSENFRKGYYVYIGSAMRNLKQRVHRHISYKESGKKKHWHIDDLLVYGNVKMALLLPNSQKLEEQISGMVSQFLRPIPSLHRPLYRMAGTVTNTPYGASDCAKVDSNLYFLRTLEDFYIITRKALELNWENKRVSKAEVS